MTSEQKGVDGGSESVLDRLLWATKKRMTRDYRTVTLGEEDCRKVAELIAADHEYDAAQRDWDLLTNTDPDDFGDDECQRIADRHEAALMRRIHAMDALAARGQP